MEILTTYEEQAEQIEEESEVFYVYSVQLEIYFEGKLFGRSQVERFLLLTSFCNNIQFPKTYILCGKTDVWGAFLADQCSEVRLWKCLNSLVLSAD